AVCFEGEGNRLRYHALFRAFLQAQLERESPAAFLDLHRRAAMWFERHGDAVRAAEHFMVCGEPEQAAHVVDREARTLLRVGHLETLIEWVQRLPEGVTLTTPTLTFCAAEAASDAGWVEQALAWLALSEAACRSGVAGGDLLALVLSARALIDYNRGRYTDSQRTAQEALALLLDGGAPSGEASAEAQRVIGMCALRLGDLAGAEQHLRAALEGSEIPHRQVLAQEGLALCLFERGQVKDALRMGRAAVATCRRLGSPGYLAEALNDLACSLYPLGKYDEALEALREGLEAARQAGHRRIEAFALVSLGEVLLDVGDAEAAVDALAEGVKIAAEIDQVLLLAHGQEMLALACFQLKDTYRATLAAQDACDLAERQENRGPIGRCKAVYGLVRVAAGDVERGRGCLAEACEMLERTGSAQEVARAYLFLAHAYHQEGRAQETAGALSRALDLYAAGEFAHRLLVDSRFVLPTLKEAAQGSSSSARVAAVLREASQFRSAAQRTLKQWRDASVEPGFSFRAYGFGRGHVEREGIPIAASAWDAASARHFFFYFLSYPVRAREQVFADIWPDQEPSTGLFHTTKYRVRRALGVTAVLHEDGAYRLNAGLDVWYDVREFEQLIERARRVPRVQALRYLRQAIDLYGGDFLADCYADWCVELREALRQQYLEAIGTLAGHLLALRRPGEAAPILRRGLEVDNLREDLCRQLMRALALDGRADEAAAHYRQCARVLERELGFEPESETTELYRAICAGRFP
ncbi:MAG: tetratricopeptide repeat protein, partial [Anaerolineae bacterium]|nr:tetratricopeptide repeat protein [Anaerolineae bacterium]